MQPDFIGIGMQRCASSWLHYVLGEHPQINKPPSGIHFFNYYFERGDLWYSSELKRYFTEDGITGEFSTTYSYPEFAKKVAERIFSFSPNVKLIASIRHPMDRCYSDYRRSLRIGEIQDQSVQDAITVHSIFVQRSLYAPIIEAYLKFFQREQFQFINYDNIVDDPKSVAISLYNFLGVDPEFRPSILEEKLGATYEMKSARFEVLLGKLQTSGRNFLQSVGLRTAAPLIKRSGIIKLLRFINTDSKANGITLQSHTDEIQMVYSLFNNDIEETMKLTGLDLQTWLSN